MQRPPLIQTFGEVKEKLELLEVRPMFVFGWYLIRPGPRRYQNRPVAHQERR
jgi:hypothetical protein